MSTALLPMGPFRRVPLGIVQRAVTPTPITANLLWRYDTPDLPVQVSGSDIVGPWPDAGPNGADVYWPGPGFVFDPPFPRYFTNVFGTKPAVRQVPGRPIGLDTERPCAGTLPFSGGAVVGSDVTIMLAGFIPDQQDAPTNGSIGILQDYSLVLGVAPNNVFIPYLGGVGAFSKTMGFAYNMASIATGTVPVDIADRVPGNCVLTWAFDKASTTVEVWQDTTLLGTSAADPNLAAGFDFGMDDGMGENGNYFSDFAGSDAILGDIAASWAWSVKFTPAEIAQQVAYFQSFYSL